MPIAPEKPINNNSTITIGLVVLVVSFSGYTAFRAGQVLTELDYMKASLTEIKTDMTDVKRTVNRMESQQRNAGHGEKTYQ